MQVRKHPVKYVNRKPFVIGFSEGDVELSQEKWISTFFHIQDKHE